MSWRRCYRRWSVNFITPIVTLEALFEALVASGQALVLPFSTVGAAGLLRFRRLRHMRTVLEKSQLS